MKYFKIYDLDLCNTWQIVPQDKMTSPRYMDAERKVNDIIPLCKQFESCQKEKQKNAESLSSQ